MAVENRIKEIRKKQHMLQSDLAKKIGCERKTISSYESKSRCPSLEIAILLVHSLNTTLDELFYIVDNENAQANAANDNQSVISGEITVEVIKTGGNDYE